MKNVLIMGAGHQGLAMAAHLSANNVLCYLWNRSEEHIRDIIDTRVVRCSGILNGNIRIEKISSNLEDVLQKTIMVTTPSSAHRDIAKILAGYVDTSYVIILNPGRTFGILEFMNILKENGCTSLPLVAETQTIIYTCRRDMSNGVKLYALKKGVKIASLSLSDTIKTIKRIPSCIQANFVPAASFLETSLGNVGMILHCAPLLMNVGWVENKKVDFEYYYDGISESIASLLERLDKERIEVSSKMGYRVESVSEWLIRTYHTKGNNLFEQLQNNEHYRGIDAPLSIHHRYIEEDVPNGLVPLESAAMYLGMKTPIASTVIDFANIVMDTDYRYIGRKYATLIRNFKGE